MENKFNVQHLNNPSLLEGLKQHLSEERHSQALFACCTEALKLSEGSTCRRIQAARTAKKYPILFKYIEKGDIHLEAISLIAPLLANENHQDLIQRACHKTKREVELLVASLAPKPNFRQNTRRRNQHSPANVARVGHFLISRLQKILKFKMR